MPPQVVTPPQESIQASRGQTVTFTCVAIGVPTPIINWRLNWGHIPSHPRCSSGPGWGRGMWERRRGPWPRPDLTCVLGPTRVTVTSEGGRGTLIIRDVKEADQGAYTCEAMNARGMVFGIPDGVLELIPQRGTADGRVGPRGGVGAKATWLGPAAAAHSHAAQQVPALMGTSTWSKVPPACPASALVSPTCARAAAASETRSGCALTSPMTSRVSRWMGGRLQAPVGLEGRYGRAARPGQAGPGSRRDVGQLKKG